MKRTWWCVSVLLGLVISGPPAAALDTTPSVNVPTKVNGPLFITGYSFSGHSLRYVQAYNSSNAVLDLKGWRVTVEAGASSQTIATLDGLVAPNKYFTVARSDTLPSATFIFTSPDTPSDPPLNSVSLVPPESSHYLNEVASPTITSSTPRISGNPATFYLSRNVSASTGNYLSTYAGFIPNANTAIVSDALYSPPAVPEVSIVEIFADSIACSPFEVHPVCADYVKIYNETTGMVDLSKYRIRSGSYGQAAASSNTTSLKGVIDSGHYAAFPVSLSASGSWLWLEDTFGLEAYVQSQVAYPSNNGYDQQAWSYDVSSGRWRWTTRLSPMDVPNDFDPIEKINECQGLMISEIAANTDDDDQFIEIVNMTSDVVDVTGCEIQTNRSSTKRHTLKGTLYPGQQQVVYVKDTDLTLTKTTRGVVYLLSSDGLREVDQVAYDSLAPSTSWAIVDGGWRQTYVVTPAAVNQWAEYAACTSGYSRSAEGGVCVKSPVVLSSSADCGEGKYRNPTTNRCKTIEADGELSSCGDGQYRNPETNRCRAIASTASLLAPCSPGQERNPETNRCRAVPSGTDLKPCSAGQVRSTETNRCRATAADIAADFPVEAVMQSAEATMGWWAFGGVGMVAVGYAGWEWRREVGVLLRRIGTFGIGRT